MYNNSKTAVANIRWWKLLFLDLMEKEMMQKVLPMMPVMAMITYKTRIILKNNILIQTSITPSTTKPKHPSLVNSFSFSSRCVVLFRSE